MARLGETLDGESGARENGHDFAKAVWPLVMQSIACQRRAVGIGMRAVALDGPASAEIVVTENQIVAEAGLVSGAESVEQWMKFHHIQEAAGLEQLHYSLCPRFQDRKSVV